MSPVGLRKMILIIAERTHTGLDFLYNVPVWELENIADELLEMQKGG